MKLARGALFLSLLAFSAWAQDDADSAPASKSSRSRYSDDAADEKAALPPPAADEPPPPPGMHKLNAEELHQREKTRPAPTPAARSAPSSVSGTKAAVFAVGIEASGEPAARAVQDKLASALGQGGVEMVDYGKLFPPSPADPLPEADKLMAAGRAAYDNLDTDTAAQKFSDAVNYFMKHAADADPSKLARADIFLGAARLLNNDKPGAKEAFERALVADPNAKPQSELFGADVQSAFQGAQVTFAGRPKGKLDLTSVPPGAKAWIRGAEAGVTPLKGVELPQGRIQVVLRKPGYDAYGAFPSVLGGRTVEVQAQLNPSPGLSAVEELAQKVATPESFGGTAFPPEANAIGERTGARYLVMARVGIRVEIQAWDLSTGDRLTGLIARGPDDTAGLEKAARSVREWIKSPPSHFAEHIPGVAKQWWFWAGVGGAAVAAVAIGAAASSAHPHSNIGIGLP